MERRHRAQIFAKILSAEDSDSFLRPAREPLSTPSPPASGHPISVLPGSFAPQRALAARLSNLGDHASAAELLRQALRAAEAGTPDPVLLFGLHLGLAEALRESGRPDEARDVLDRAADLVRLLSPTGSALLQAELGQARAAVACRLQDLATAEQHLLDAMEQAETLASAEARLCALHADLGQLYVLAGHPEDGTRTLLEGLALAETRPESLGTERIRLLKLLAGVSHQLGAPDVSISHLLEAYEVARTWNFQDEMAQLEAVLGTLYAESGQFQTAHDWLATAIQRTQQQPSADGRVVALLRVVLAQIEAVLGFPRATDTYRGAVALQLDPSGFGIGALN